MLVKISKEEFEKMDNVSLIWTCIEPVIHQIRGKNFLVKSEVFGSLNSGQKALLMFQMFYGHSFNGIMELFDHLSYLLSENGVWSGLKKGIRFFGESEIVQLIDEMEEVYQILTDGSCGTDPGRSDFRIVDTTPELRNIIDSLNMRMTEMMPAALKTVGAYLRNNSREFLQIEG